MNGIILIPKIFACAYSSSGFLGFPYWYQYLPPVQDANGACVPSLTAVSDIWLIVAAIVEILLRIAAIAAVAMVVYSGFQFVTSQGDPNRAKGARSTLVNSVIGLIIAVIAAATVSFLAGKF